MEVLTEEGEWREGDEKGVVRILSSDGSVFGVPEEIVKECKVLGIMVDKDLPFEEARRGEIEFPVRAEPLKRAMEYLAYKKKYWEERGNVKDFVVQERENLDLLEVASFLRI